MNIKRTVLSILKETGYPTYYATNYNGTDDTFIIFYIVDERTHEVLDNEEASIYYKVQVQIVSNGDYDDLADEVLQRMRANGFGRLYSAETFDIETNFYSKSIQFEYVHFAYLEHKPTPLNLK